ncbi:hypothetical protein [Maritimibacter sp. DP1N21-5]|uniref:hypothetical protein n=1 Tax=Maritimibacter sp. DP1N21-5 TaxID=2836867 RepID=UPI001C485BD8|nr:hypothetical protein [Maritimibacter sp. DP1N21-5]MBV7408635.1 hypothetical protein [Maritimibacter sp. DP1N21-5]
MRPEGWTGIFGKAGHLLAVLEAGDDLIRAVAPEAYAQAYPAYRSVSYGVGPKKNTEGAVYLALQSNWVNLGFYQGASLPDPCGILKGTGKALRHVKLTAWPENDRALRDLVEAAFAERREALGR